jgi:hypothetical protein
LIAPQHEQGTWQSTQLSKQKAASPLFAGWKSLSALSGKPPDNNYQKVAADQNQ